jgi:hypothetical protein
LSAAIAWLEKEGVFGKFGRQATRHAVTDSNALCLDGGRYAYFLCKAQQDPSTAPWIIYMQGGGFCYDFRSCLTRSRNELGSSKVIEDEGAVCPSGQVMLSFCFRNSSHNPKS